MHEGSCGKLQRSAHVARSCGKLQRSACSDVAEDDVSQRTQRRTAEQIVDPPALVFPERISLSLRTLSWFIEAAKASSQDQNLQRTVEQNINDHMNKAISLVVEEILEARDVVKTAPQQLFL